MTPLLAVFELVLFMTVPKDLSVHYYLLCIVCHSVAAFHYNARFFITLISPGSQNERYNEATVYLPFMRKRCLNAKNSETIGDTPPPLNLPLQCIRM